MFVWILQFLWELFSLKGEKSQSGIIAKAPTIQGNKVQAGTVTGSESGRGNISSNSQGRAFNQSGAVNELSAYLAQLKRSLQVRANSSYPARERRLKKEGVVTLSLSIAPSGQVVNVNVLVSSGHSSLDAAAVQAAQSVKMSTPPAGLGKTLRVPIKFSVQ